MTKRKKKRKLKAWTIWSLIIGYVVAGAIVAVLYLSRNAPDAEDVNVAQQGLSNAWGLFPIIVMLWPIFLVIFIVQMLL